MAWSSAAPWSVAARSWPAAGFMWTNSEISHDKGRGSGKPRPFCFRQSVPAIVCEQDELYSASRSLIDFRGLPRSFASLSNLASRSLKNGATFREVRLSPLSNLNVSLQPLTPIVADRKSGLAPGSLARKNRISASGY